MTTTNLFIRLDSKQQRSPELSPKQPIMSDTTVFLLSRDKFHGKVHIANNGVPEIAATGSCLFVGFRPVVTVVAAVADREAGFSHGSGGTLQNSGKWERCRQKYLAAWFIGR